MKKHNKTIGFLGESMACSYLEKNGYQILEKNWGNKWGEIDIIAKVGQTIVYVEVKTKTGQNYGRPEQMVNPRKLRQIERMASVYSAGINAPKRIDVIAVLLTRDKKLQSINHYQAVY